MSEHKEEAHNGAPGQALEQGLEQALDQALARSLRPPTLSAAFRRGLEAAIARSNSHSDHALLRARLEREHRQLISELHSGYMRVSQRTLLALLAAAFGSGIALVLAMPWLTEHFGRNAVLVLSGLGAAVALACGALSWWPRSTLARLLD